MSIQELRCGCKLLNQACVISGHCTATPPHTSENPPSGGRVGAVPPTPAAAMKKHAARESGRKLKAGRYRMDPIQGGEVVRVEEEDDATRS